MTQPGHLFTKRLLIVFGFLLMALSSTTLVGEEITLKGIYQGKNLYIMNPFVEGSKFCVTEILINGSKTNDFLQSSAIEVDFSALQLPLGSPITLTIKHSESCKPKILNPEVIKPQSTFELKSIKIDVKTNTLQWETVKESGSLPYVIEQFRWNKWIPIGQIEGKGEYTQNSYSYPITFHSGLNRFRVRQTNFNGDKRYSREASFRSTIPPVTFQFPKNSNEIIFSAETDYEIWNTQGKLLLKGRGQKIDISSLSKGDYFLNFDASTEMIKKR
ncbi:MAG TPA: hypothetical protein PK990_02405 [Salinivirgaceae bacterium]|nr:hypothetical protein [Salinivirgaceae bacterium]